MKADIVPEERFVGRKHEMSALQAGLRRGDSMVVIGGRRSGKTWLVRRIRSEDVHRPVYFVSGDKLVFAAEDLALKKLAKTLGIAWDHGWDVFDAREAIEEALRAIGECALIVDEADRILGLAWAGGFLAWLRSLIDTAGLGRSLAIVAVGGPVLDHYRNPQDHGSPVMNLAHRLFLAPLDREAVRELVADRLDAPTPEEIVNAAGGQPALAQSFLREWRASPGTPHVEVVHRMIDASRSQFVVWREQLGPDGRRFLRELRAEGVERAGVIDDEGYLRAKYLCLIRIEGERVLPGPSVVVRQVLGTQRLTYDVAISYAEEDHQLGRAIHDGLTQRGIATFFAPAETAWVWAKDLSHFLPNLYGQQAAVVIVLCTERYRDKHWTRVEYDAVRQAHGERVVLVSLDGRLPDDWPRGEVYLEGTPANLVKLLDLVAARVRGGVPE
jgi:hypothetical protein